MNAFSYKVRAQTAKSPSVVRYFRAHCVRGKLYRFRNLWSISEEWVAPLRAAIL